ncbi:hypothetical protein PoB_006255700 [Plakobranchus ocellatus]|uniref:Arrestin C-terminal-like domain-containing protein n=1 Tax=Plakobranchus ocellatus TaxID=259542 RepID=A0AAV4CVW8_9GAST|nr:hypothetical protein PoB_006255700 [Plakobranchus ocellatus]
MSSCFSLFCQVNQQGHPGEWRDDLNNNPGNKQGGLATDSWGDLPHIPDTAAIGHLHLSFEYHKTNLKIRVWQVSDLLLPPPQISMIESVFVRSYLIPDAVKKTNRKTEDVRVETSNKKESSRISPMQSGIQHIFTPSSFKFDTPLLYTGVTKAIVQERSIRLEVCMTQKHTHRAFLMAIVHMPLTVAVRRPIRERYPLIPCMNYTIPNNMRVYSARDIILENAGSKQETGLLTRSNSSTSSTRDGTSSSASQKFVSLNLSDSDDDEAEVAGILEIQTHSPVSKPSSSPTSSSIAIPEDSDPSDLKVVVMGKTRSLTDNISIDMIGQDRKPKAKKKIIPNEIFSKQHNSKGSDTDESEDSKSQSIMSQHKGSHSPSTVVEIGQSQGDAVVDISKLQGDVVIELEKEKLSVDHPVTAGTKAGKKKIIPPSELLTRTAQKLSEQTGDMFQNPVYEEGLINRSESGCVYDDIASHNASSGQDSKEAEVSSNSELNGKEEQVQVDQSMDNPKSGCTDSGTTDTSLTVEDMTKMSSLRISSRIRSGSEVSSEVGSTNTSRPETPVWDFYDFADEEGGEENSQGGESSADRGNQNGDEASKALGTLQKSILRLSRSTRLGAGGSSGVLETERVDGPVLPTVMIEDFEEMEEALKGEDDETEQRADTNIEVSDSMANKEDKENEGKIGES